MQHLVVNLHNFSAFLSLLSYTFAIFSKQLPYKTAQKRPFIFPFIFDFMEFLPIKSTYYLLFMRKLPIKARFSQKSVLFMRFPNKYYG